MSTILLELNPRDRLTLSTTIERLIALVDALDGDPDLEDGADAEPEETDQNGDEGDFSQIEDGGWNGLRYDGSGARIAGLLLEQTSPRKYDQRLVGERVRVLQNGDIFRTFVPADSGYVVVPKPRRVRQTVRP